MPIVAVAGDACTTTTVALAAGWPLVDEVLVVEADPTGGDLAAWFGLAPTPSLSTVVTRVPDGAWNDVEPLTRLADVGVRLITGPWRAGEAQQAVSESTRAVVPTLAALRSPIMLADTGRLLSNPTLHPFVGGAAVTVVVHRQATQSAAAAAVRLQRLSEAIVQFAESSTHVIVLVVGRRPFDLDEVQAFLVERCGPCDVLGLPVDALAASVLAGRAGVSARRLTRLPLMRSAAGAAATIRSTLPRVAAAPRPMW